MTSSPNLAERYRVHGMTCAGCARRLERGLTALDGVSGVLVNPMTGEVVLSRDPDQVDGKAIHDAVAAMGFGADPVAVESAASLDALEVTVSPARRRALQAGLLAAPVVILLLIQGAARWEAPFAVWLELALALPVLAGPGRATIGQGFRALRAGAPGLDTLVATGVLAAYSTGLLSLAGVDVALFAGMAAPITALHLTGRYLDARARLRVAGMLGHGAESDDSGAGAATVWKAQASQPAIHTVAGQMMGLFVFLALGLSVFTGVFWLAVPEMMHALGGWVAPWLPWSPEEALSGPGRAFYAGIAVLLAAAPCAWGLAAPSAVMAGTGVAAGRGIRICDGAAVQRLRQMTILCFARTGTLTRGEPKVKELEVVGDAEPHDVLEWAAGVTLFSAHPVAKAINAHAIRAHCAMLPACDFEAAPGRGARAEVDGATVIVGKPSFLAEAGVDLAPIEHIVYRMQREGKTAVAVARAGTAIAVVGLVDPPRAESVRAIKILKRMGIPCVMVSGDDRAAAGVFADQCGIERVLADVRPGETAKAVARLKQETIRNVGMVGDGVEDAAALAAADVGIALGTGPVTATESMDVALVNDDLTGVVEVIQLGKATYNKIVQNLLWAFGYNLVIIPLAMVGLVHPVMAVVLAMAGSLAMYWNAERLRRFDPERVTQEVLRR